MSYKFSGRLAWQHRPISINTIFDFISFKDIVSRTVFGAFPICWFLGNPTFFFELFLNGNVQTESIGKQKTDGCFSKSIHPDKSTFLLPFPIPSIYLLFYTLFINIIQNQTMSHLESLDVKSFKTIIIGKSAVGKSTLLLRYVDG